MVYITAVRVTGGNGHEHITHVRYREATSPTLQSCTREEMVAWIRDKGGKARVQSTFGDVDVLVVDGRPPHLRTIANNRWGDNLLSLPRF